jgi:hypothetical protein
VADDGAGWLDLDDLLPQDGDVDLTALAALARDSLIAVGRFTDEELHLLRDVAEVPRDDLEAPRLGRLDAAAQEVALDAALTLLIARGDVTRTVDGDAGADDPLAVHGRHAVLVELREHPHGVLRSQLDTRGEAPTLAALYHVTDGLLLVEDVDPIGIHTFVLTDPERAAGWLVERLDPDAVARTTGDPRSAASIAELGAELDDLLEASSRVSQLHVARVNGERIEQLSESVYTCPDRGVHRLSGWEAEDGSGAVLLQELGRDGVEALARELVEEAIRPRR